jgi:acetolactate synthase-1/2/3 large subunit
MARMTGAQALLKSLMDHGIRTIFGLPGGQLDHFYDAMYRVGSRIRYVGARHEQGAAYMAFGAARSTGHPAAYVVVPGPGVLNTAAALSTAYACNAPVLCVTGQIPSQSIGRGYGELHELPDQLATLRTLTKWSTRIEQPKDEPAQVAQAFRRLVSGRPRPVSIEMAMDIMAMESEVAELAVNPPPAPPEPDPEAIAAAARRIAAAKTPMIYVGGGAAGAAAETRALAEQIQAPVVAFRSGRGVVSDEHPLGLTLPAGHRLWPTVDLVIGIGSRMMEPLRHWGRTRDLSVVRIDIDADEIMRYGAPTVGIQGDSAHTLRALLPAIERCLDRRRQPGLDVAGAKAATAAEIRQIQPQLSWLEAIRDVLPRDGIFCDEITQCGFASWYGFPVYAPRQHINCGYQGTLGYGYATALGVKVAHPDRAVVSIAGDGGFLFTAQELATAVQNQIGLKTIVFNSNSFGNVQRQQREWFGNRLIGSDLRNPDFMALAAAYGAAAYRVRTPAELRPLLERALGEPGPAVIEVPVGDMVSPWKHIILPALPAAVAEPAA